MKNKKIGIWEEIKSSSGITQLGLVFKLLTLLVALGSLLIAVLGLIVGFLEMKKVEVVKDRYRDSADEAQLLARKVMFELARDGIRDAEISFNDIVTQVDFEGFDMDITFSFVSSSDHTSLSMREDAEFDVGQYTSTRRASRVIGRVFDEVIQYNLSQFPRQLETEVYVKGVADPIPVRSGAIYPGVEFLENESYYNINEQREKTITLIPNQTKLTNEAIAFLRAFHAKKSISHIDLFKNSKTTVQVEESSVIGDRRAILIVNLAIDDALRDAYEELGPAGKMTFRLLENVGVVDGA